jgi:hypothetical protein
VIQYAFVSYCTYNLHRSAKLMGNISNGPLGIIAITVTVRCHFIFIFIQGHHNKLEGYRVNQSEGHLSTRRFSLKLVGDRRETSDDVPQMDWTG